MDTSFLSPERGEATDRVFEELCFSVPTEPASFEDAAAGIARAIELDERSAFLEGLSARLCELGFECTVQDSKAMLEEIRRRYRSVLGKTCPKTVCKWIEGTPPSGKNRRNNYELCYALEMDCRQTTAFFQKCFLNVPWVCRDRVDAVFLYCMYHGKPYSDASRMLDMSEGFVPQENADTATSRIFQTILECQDDGRFLDYLSKHCYGEAQQFSTARELILRELETAKEYIIRTEFDKVLSPERMNSLVITELLGYRYQAVDKKAEKHKLPKRFTESLPNDVTLGQIISGEKVSYETLRKTIMLLHFFNFYSDAVNDADTVTGNLLDFYDELYGELFRCGFVPVYERHPFDCLLLYCANTLDPIAAFYTINERN